MGQDISERNYIQAALNGETMWSQLFYSYVTETNVMAVAAPIRSNGRSGDMLGTINISIDDSGIDHIVHMGLDTIGLTADAYLVGGDYVMLSNMRFGDLASGAALNEKMISEATEPLMGPIQAEDFEFREITSYTNYLGDPVLGALNVSRLGRTPVGFVIVANCASIPHDPDEIERLDPFDKSFLMNGVLSTDKIDSLPLPVHLLLLCHCIHELFEGYNLRITALLFVHQPSGYTECRSV